MFVKDEQVENLTVSDTFLVFEESGSIYRYNFTEGKLYEFVGDKGEKYWEWKETIYYSIARKLALVVYEFAENNTKGTLTSGSFIKSII